MKKISDAARHIQGQPMFKLLEKAQALEKEGRRILHFEIGTPDFETPPQMVQAAWEAMKAGKTKYVNSHGIWELRKKVCDYTKEDLGFRPSESQVLILPANSAVYFLMRCVMNPGEEALVPDPGFSTYYSASDFIGVKPVRVPLLQKRKFQINGADLEERATAKTRLVIVNSPNNPTGSILTRENMESVAAFAEKKDLYLLSDEVYRRVVYGPKPPASPCVVDRCRERSILLSSFSKSHAMSGWRLGYVIGPEPVIEKMTLVFQTVISCLPPFIQEAGVAALGHETDSEVKKMVAELARRREAIVKGLNSIPGVDCLAPEGAFYVFPDISGTGLDDRHFADLMLEKAGVALLPGSDFGDHSAGHVRMSYSSIAVPLIEEAVDKMKAALKEAGVKAGGVR